MDCGHGRLLTKNDAMEYAEPSGGPGTIDCDGRGCG
jgi:hypothetical protein